MKGKNAAPSDCQHVISPESEVLIVGSQINVEFVPLKQNPS